MREIKFRAWETEHKEMVNDIRIAPEYDWKVFSDNDAMCQRVRSSNWIFMQYTGLKDKNGKEIYEGDIVRWWNKHKGVVIWEDHDCCFNVNGYYDPSADYPSMAFMENESFEVIGNIHQGE